jgi:hypothetical protein
VDLDSDGVGSGDREVHETGGPSRHPKAGLGTSHFMQGRGLPEKRCKESLSQPLALVLGWAILSSEHLQQEPQKLLFCVPMMARRKCFPWDEQV